MKIVTEKDTPELEEGEEKLMQLMVNQPKSVQKAYLKMTTSYSEHQQKTQQIDAS